MNNIASMKHLATYRNRGLGKSARGLDKRVRDLRVTLKDRKWGEETEDTGKAHRGDSGSGTGANGIIVGGGEGKRKGKRKGKKERMKAKVATDAVEGDDAGVEPLLGTEATGQSNDVKREDRRLGISHVAQNGDIGGDWDAVKKRKSDDVGENVADGESKKKKRKKKQKREARGGESMLEVYE